SAARPSIRTATPTSRSTTTWSCWPARATWSNARSTPPARERHPPKSACTRADGGDHLSESDFDASLEGLPDNALARVYVDVGSLLKQSGGAAAARRIEWVDSLRTLGLTVT